MGSSGWVDLHAHVLPALDDGPPDVDAALDLLRALEADGVETVCATPHVQPYPYATTAEQRDEARDALGSRPAEAGLSIQVVQGGEVDLEYAVAWDDRMLRRFTLDGGPAVLVEFPWVGGWPLALEPACRNLVRRGFLPVIAHPERARIIQNEPRRLEAVLATGAVCQITAGSLLGAFGSGARDVAFRLLRHRRAHVVASDAHGNEERSPSLRRAHAVLAESLGDAFADAVFEDAPRRVLEGEVPRLPEPVRPRRRLLRRRG